MLGKELYHSSCSFFFFASSSWAFIFSCIEVLAISILVVFTSSSLFVYFSTILKSNSSLFSSFTLFTNSSASSIVFTFSIVVLFKAIS